MSIIYEALQKRKKNVSTLPAQTINLPPELQQTAHKKTLGLETIDKVLIFIVLSLILLLSIGILQRLSTPQVAHTIPTPTTNVPQTNIAEFKRNHILTGVFLSPAESFAMINDKFLHVGDDIDGFKIVALNLNYVKLKNAQTTLILKS